MLNWIWASREVLISWYIANLLILIYFEKMGLKQLHMQNTWKWNGKAYPHLMHLLCYETFSFNIGEDFARKIAYVLFVSIEGCNQCQNWIFLVSNCFLYMKYEFWSYVFNFPYRYVFLSKLRTGMSSTLAYKNKINFFLI